MSYEVFAPYYDLLTQNVNYKGYAGRVFSLIRRYLKAAPGPGQKITVADIACGTLNLGICLEDLGFKVIGTDLSDDMISAAKHKIKDSGSSIILLKQDMRKLCLPYCADAAVCSLDALNHLPRLDSVKQAFLAAAENLKPGGLFIFDMNTPYKHRKVLADNSFVFDRPKEGVYAVWQNEYRPGDCSVKITLDFFLRQEDGSFVRKSESFRERAYHTKTVAELVENCGFELLEIFDGLKNSAPTKFTERILYVARRI